MIYIPFVGFIVAAYRYLGAHAAYSACHAKGLPCWEEAEATWKPFDDVSVAFLVTMMALVIAWAIVKLKISAARAALAKARGEA